LTLLFELARALQWLPVTMLRCTPTSRLHLFEALHRRLAQLNRRRFAPCANAEDWRQSATLEHEARIAEGELVEHERARVRAWAMTAPTQPEAFVTWFEQLRVAGPGQGDPLFPWLATTANSAQMTWFIRQEAAGEAGFDDLVALTQIKMPARAKLELARNYWDEMGQGHASGMHGPMLDRLCEALGIACTDDQNGTVWESLALGNLMVALAANRHYAFQSIGALGVIELTAPGRAEQVNAGLSRLGFPGDVRRYFALHATLDVKHSQAWNAEVIMPLVAEDPARATAIAEGALMRLNAGALCFARYRRELFSGLLETTTLRVGDVTRDVTRADRAVAESHARSA
jgi:hypothetical protein